MQCLGQTPYLLELLEETSKGGQYFSLPGGQLDPEDKESMVLEPLDGNNLRSKRFDFVANALVFITQGIWKSGSR